MDIDPSGDGAGGVDTGQSNAASGQCTFCEPGKMCKLVELTFDQIEILKLRHDQCSDNVQLCTKHHDDNFKFYKMRTVLF